MTVILALIGGVAAWIGIWFGSDLRLINKTLETDVGRRTRANYLSAQPSWISYQNGVQRCLDWADAFYQERPAFTRPDGRETWRPYGWAAFARCYQISFIYPILIFLLYWGVSDQPVVAGIHMANGPVPGYGRAATLITLIGIFEYLRRDVPRRLSMWMGKRIGISRFNAVIEFIVFVFVLAFVLAFIYTGIVAGTFVFIFMFVGSLVGVGRAAFVATATATATFAIGVFYLGSGNASTLVTLIVYFAVFPFGNAILDFLSLSCTRFLLRHMGHGDASKLSLALRLLLDLALAFLAMLGLAVVLPVLLEAVNFVLGAAGRELFDWQELVVAVRYDSGGEGLPVLLMLLTTLLPTLFHLLAGVRGLNLAPLGARESICHKLRKPKDDWEALSDVRAIQIFELKSITCTVLAFIIPILVIAAVAGGAVYVIWNGEVPEAILWFPDILFDLAIPFWDRP